MHPLIKTAETLLNSKRMIGLVASPPDLHQRQELAARVALDITYRLVEKYGDELFPDHDLIMNMPVMMYPADSTDAQIVTAMTRHLNCKLSVEPPIMVDVIVEEIYAELSREIKGYKGLKRFHPYQLVNCVLTNCIDTGKVFIEFRTRYGLSDT